MTADDKTRPIGDDDGCSPASVIYYPCDPLDLLRRMEVRIPWVWNQFFERHDLIVGAVDLEFSDFHRLGNETATLNLKRDGAY